MSNEEDFQERARRRRETYGILAVDSKGNVVAKHGPELVLGRYPHTPEDSEANFLALHELRSLFYREVREEVPMDRTVIKLGHGAC